MKKKLDIKKLVLLNLPYVFAFYFVDKLAAVFRLAPGTEFIDKLTGGFANFGAAFANPLPSFHPVDLLIGVAGGALLKLAVYIKGKNRKKFRQGEEYGSARWGRPEDIRPYMDDDFSNNVILTQTEGLTMNSRPKQPKYARNKNILVIGGSGSGKTRFFVKPNLMQMHSSYVVTDPKGTVLVECGKMLEKNGYIIMDGSGHLYLTDEGRSVAEKTFERHRVLTKVFTKLGVSAGIAAEDACKIEHVISDETFEAIKRFVAEHSD